MLAHEISKIFLSITYKITEKGGKAQQGATQYKFLTARKNSIGFRIFVPIRIS